MVVGGPRPFRQPEFKRDDDPNSRAKGPGDVLTYSLVDGLARIESASLDGDSCQPAQFGFSVDLLHDAVLVVGAPTALFPGTKTDTGLVKIFEWNEPHHWNCVQTLAPVASPGQDAVLGCEPEDKATNTVTRRRFGHSVAIAGTVVDEALESGTIVVGAPGDDNGGSVSVYVYQATPKQWRLTWKLPRSETDAAGFGRVVDIAADGNTIVVGACEDCSLCVERVCSQDKRVECTGPAQCVDVDGSDIGPCEPACDNDTLRPCSVNADCGAENATGTVTILEKAAGASDPDAWEATRTFTAADVAQRCTGLAGQCTRLGVSAAIAGSEVVMGAPGDGTAAGEAFTSDRGDQGWSDLELVSPALAADEPHVRFGENVAIGDELLLVAAPGGESPGVYVFERTADVQGHTSRDVQRRSGGQRHRRLDGDEDCCFGEGMTVDQCRVAIPCSCDDPGNTGVGDLCCGNGLIDAGEACDDGDVEYHNGDYCQADCTRAPCGQPSTPESDPNASDALFSLRAAVGSVTCAPCVCSVNGDSTINASDALLTLRKAVGQPVTLTCPSTCP